MRFVLPLAAAVLALGALAPSAAFQIPVTAAERIADRDVLSWVIAGQGNRALAQIKAEARHAARHLELAPLPGRPRALPFNSMLAVAGPTERASNRSGWLGTPSGRWNPSAD